MFWVKCFLKPKKSKEYNTFFVENEKHLHSGNSIFNSSLFFMFWEIISDCWHIVSKDLRLFKSDWNNFPKELISLSQNLENDLEKNKKYVGTSQIDYEYYHKKSKSIIDKIDKILAQNYGFSEEELDFIINYDIKYRMGEELNNHIY
jgi:hypothetical protein